MLDLRVEQVEKEAVFFSGWEQLKKNAESVRPTESNTLVIWHDPTKIVRLDYDYSQAENEARNFLQRLLDSNFGLDIKNTILERWDIKVEADSLLLSTQNIEPIAIDYLDTYRQKLKEMMYMLEPAEVEAFTNLFQENGFISTEHEVNSIYIRHTQSQGPYTREAFEIEINYTSSTAKPPWDKQSIKYSLNRFHGHYDGQDYDYFTLTSSTNYAASIVFNPDSPEAEKLSDKSLSRQITSFDLQLLNFTTSVLTRIAAKQLDDQS